MKKFSLLFAVIMLGMTAIVTQIILIRELLVVFSGNELSIGLFLTQWLMAQAIGSYLFTKTQTADSKILPAFIILQSVFSGLLPVVIFLVRTVKSIFGILPGESTSLLFLATVSFVIILLPGFYGGALFSTACRMFSIYINSSVRTISNVYSIEAVGSLAGGMVVTYVSLVLLTPMESAFALLILNLVAALFLYLFVLNKKPAMGSAGYALVVMIVLIMTYWGLGGVRAAHEISLSNQWKNYVIHNYHNTIYGNTLISGQAGQLNILINGKPVAHLPTPDYMVVEEIAHFPLLAHENPKTILLLGTGFGGVLEEILKYDIQKLDYVEPDAILIKTIANFIPEVQKVLADPRIKICYTDGRAFLTEYPGTYDVIIINYPDPVTLELNRFYTTEFFQLCRNHLRPKGLIYFNVTSSSSYMNDEMIKLNGTLISSAGKVFNNTKIIPNEMTSVILSDDASSEILNPELLSSRLAERNIDTRLLSKSYFQIKLDSAKLAWYIGQLNRVKFNFNYDLVPSAVFYSLALWTSANEPALSAILEIIEEWNLSTMSGFLFVIILIILLLRFKKNYNKTYIIFMPVLSTGYFGMSVSILLALLFQVCYGYIYYWLGLLVAAFMAGIAAGAFISGKWSPDNVKLKIIGLESGMFLLGGLILFSLSLNLQLLYTELFRYQILMFALSAGVLVGMEFPLSTQILSDGHIQYANAAGKIYALDLIGACTGGILTSVFFIPVLGIPQTLLFLLILKISSILLLLLFFKPDQQH